MGSPLNNKYGTENRSAVIELVGSDFDSHNNIIHASFRNKFSLIKVYAPWCGYCTKMTNDMNFLAENLPKEGIMVGAINFEKNKELVGKLETSGFPTMFIGNTTGHMEKVNMGSRSVEDILNAICAKTKEYHNAKCCKRDGDTIKC
jgi:thiol-disulfide isomerase/thioredoxin